MSGSEPVDFEAFEAEFERRVELARRATRLRAEGATLRAIAGELLPDLPRKAGASRVWALLQMHAQFEREIRRRKGLR